MKLYNVPPRSYILLNSSLPLYFRKVDGMYSLCYDKHNRLIHLSALSEVEILDSKPDDWE